MVFGSGDRIVALSRRVANLERLVEVLAERAGISREELEGIAPDYWLPQDVKALAEEGQTIQAIKRLREQTGMGLREAKELVDRIPKRP